MTDVSDCVERDHTGCPPDCICNCHDDLPDYDFGTDAGPDWGQVARTGGGPSVTDPLDAIAKGPQYYGLQPAEEALARKDPHMSTCDEPSIEACGDCQRLLARYRRVIEIAAPLLEEQARNDLLCALGAEGRLLPEGCEIEQDFEIQWYGPDGHPGPRWGGYSLERVRELLTDPPPGAGSYLVRHRETWTSQYTAVPAEALEPVEPEGGEKQ